MLEKFLTETLKLAPRQMWGVEPLDKETYHSEFVVDYVRIYQPTLTETK